MLFIISVLVPQFIDCSIDIPFSNRSAWIFSLKCTINYIYRSNSAILLSILFMHFSQIHVLVNF